MRRCDKGHLQQQQRGGGGVGQEEDDDDQSRVLYELCNMIADILRDPPSLPAVNSSSSSSSSCRGLVGQSQAPPAALASLFLGVSLALMLFGSVTFVIGMFLMPLVIVLVVLFYLVGLLYNVSEMGRSLLWPGYSDVPSPAWRFL